MKNINTISGTRLAVVMLAFILIGSITCAQSGKTNAKTANCSAGEIIFPLKHPDTGGRFLVDQTNRPFFWLGDAAWSLIAQLSNEDVDTYLDNRKNKGFSVILVSLIEHKFSSNAPANFYGDPPFTNGCFISPNEKYFEHADYVIKAAERRGILVLLAPLYLGYSCKDEGWCAEVQASSPYDLRRWGKFVGNRYKNFSNIVWLIGGDADPGPVKEKVLEFVAGIREYDTIHLFSAHNEPETMAVTHWPKEKWLSVNNVYSYDSVLVRHFRTAWLQVPIMPYYQAESAYENEHQSTPQEIRDQAYKAILSGAMGNIFGNCPVWHFGSSGNWCKLTDWKNEMNNSGSVSMDFFQRLFRSRSWQTLIPDFDHKIVPSGHSSPELKNDISTAITSDRKTLIAYLPSARELSVDLSKISGKNAKCSWYNPSNGVSTEIGTYGTHGNINLTPKGEGDWVLVIDAGN